jgi:hypothetical protein
MHSSLAYAHRLLQRHIPVFSLSPHVPAGSIGRAVWLEQQWDCFRSQRSRLARSLGSGHASQRTRFRRRSVLAGSGLRTMPMSKEPSDSIDNSGYPVPAGARAGVSRTRRSTSRRLIARALLPVPIPPRRPAIQEAISIEDIGLQCRTFALNAHSAGVCRANRFGRKHFRATRATQEDSALQTLAEVINRQLQVRESIEQGRIGVPRFRREQVHCRDVCKSVLRLFGADSYTMVSRDWRSRRKSQRRSDSCSAGYVNTAAESVHKTSPR